MNEFEQLKSGKEIEDIISEKNKILQLVNEANWNEIQTYLQKLNVKYSAETFVYNMDHSNPPKDLKENAGNCISFLHSLIEAKAIEALKSD